MSEEKKLKRIRSMQRNARERKKYVPTVNEILCIWPHAMVCSKCGAEMRLNQKHGEPLGNVISLQHDRSGEIRLICMSCNTGHGSTNCEEKTWYSMKPHQRWCGRCRRVLPEGRFCRNKQVGHGRHRWCRDCANKKARDYYHARRRNIIENLPKPEEVE